MFCVFERRLAVHFDYFCHSQLAGTPNEPHLRLLELFAYGTYAEAQSKGDELPTLTPPQVRVVPWALIFSFCPTTNVQSRKTWNNIHTLDEHDSKLWQRCQDTWG